MRKFDIDSRKSTNLLLPMAVAGMMAGLTVGCAKEEKAAPAGPSSAKPAAEKAVDTVAAAKHACKGLNACKGMGGCSSGDAGCSGKNSCKGKGGCATVEKHSCAGKNSCKGLGGCTSGDNGCKAKNSCKGKGGCAVPITH